MFSFVSFLNNTDFPYISVVEDERVLVEILPRREKSKFFAVDSGSLIFDFFSNSPKPFLNIYIPLYPGRIYTLSVYESAVDLYDHSSEFF